MFPQFGATAESLSKASSLVFRIGTDAHLYDDPDDVSIGPLLDSKYDSEKIEALKRLLALIAQGVDVSNFFPQVVKNVASQPMEIKKLVYLYLLHYAERRPDEALLSINCFQKDLSDPNPLVRAWALRAMAGIRLHAIAPIVSMAVSKCARDPSVYVRKCAANALPKLTDLHQEENASTFEELVGLLLNDQSPGVVGAAAAAFNSVCPHNLPLIGRNFRRLCETLPDVEDWGQIVLIDILLRYVVARHGLVKESVMFSSESPNQYQFEMDFSDDHSKCGRDEKISQAYAYELDASIFISYMEGSEEYLSQGAHIDGNCCMLNSDANIIGQNEDIKLLLQCTSPLLWSQNSAVVLAAAGVHWIMAPRVNVDKIVKPLLFILRSSHTSKYVVLCNIQVFAKAMPHLFAPYYEDFFVCSMDPYPIRTLKLEILSTIATDSSIAYIFQEIQDYVRDPDRRFAADAVAAIGLCAQKIPSVAKTCIEGLLALIKEESSISDCSSAEGEAGILVQAIMSIKAVIKQNPVVYEKLIVQLARLLDTIKEPSARALIVWIVGEYCSIGNIITRAVPVIIKYLARCFTSEELQTKHQILNTAVKVALSAQGEDALMFPRILQYLLELAKYDINYDVRDRARTMEKLLTFIMTQEGILSPHLHKELSHYIRDHIFRGKIQSTPFCSNSTRAYLPGTLSQVVLHAAPGYERLPKPCSLSESSLTISVNNVNAPNLTKSRTADSGTSESNDSGSLSGSSLDESDSNYNLRRSNSISSDNSERSDSLDVSDNGHTSKSDHHIQNASTSSPLICLSDVIGGDGSTGLDVGDKNATHLSTDLAELMSKSALESWLDDQPELSGPTSSTLSGRQASVRISVKEIAVCVRPTVHNLLQPINGNGLKVNYSFSQQISSISSFLVCVDIFFENTSAESLTNITIKDPEENVESVSQTSQTYESSLAAAEVPRIIPFEEIASLGPGEKMTKVLQIYFHHHLLPHKLVILCNEKKYLVKLQPDIGYFLKPLQLDINAFKEKEKLLPGMFEYNRRCTFSAHDVDKEEHGGHEFVNDDKILMISRRLASRVLSSANVFFVSVDMPVPVKVDDVSGLCLRFSGEILSSSKPCLLTITADGDCSDPLSLLAKVNCEETIFGLNLLNRVVTFLS